VCELRPRNRGGRSWRVAWSSEPRAREGHRRRNFEGGFALRGGSHWIGSGGAEARRIRIGNGWCHHRHNAHCEMNMSKSAPRLMNGDAAWPRNHWVFMLTSPLSKNKSLLFFSNKVTKQDFQNSPQA